MSIAVSLRYRYSIRLSIESNTSTTHRQTRRRSVDLVQLSKYSKEMFHRYVKDLKLLEISMR